VKGSERILPRKMEILYLWITEIKKAGQAIYKILEYVYF